MSVKVYSVRNINYVFMILYIPSSCFINAGLITELKRMKPMVITKYSQNSPVFINIKSEGQHVIGEKVHKLQVKPALKMESTNLTKRFSRSILPVPKLPLAPYILPLIPHSPFLPMFPDWLPKPTHPALSIDPSPLLKLSHLLGWSKRNIQIHEKLLELKHKGALTTAQYIRFQNLLLSL